MDKSNLFQNLLNFLKKTGSSGSQFSINPTISNEQIGNSVKQIANAGLPTAITPSPISPFGINSILRGGKIDDIVADSIPGEKMDFGKAMTNNITWGDMYGPNKDKKKGNFSVIERTDITKDDKKRREEGGDVSKEEDNSEALLDKKLDFLKGLNKEQLEAAFMMKGVELAGKFGEGGMRAADSYDNLTRSIAAIAGALPQYNNPGFTISPMAYQNYAFGRG